MNDWIHFDAVAADTSNWTGRSFFYGDAPVIGPGCHRSERGMKRTKCGISLEPWPEGVWVQRSGDCPACVAVDTIEAKRTMRHPLEALRLRQEIMRIRRTVKLARSED